jgi:hypothetical protein
MSIGLFEQIEVDRDIQQQRYDIQHNDTQRIATLIITTFSKILNKMLSFVAPQQQSSIENKSSYNVF